MSDISQMPEIIEASLYPYVTKEYMAAAPGYGAITNVLPYDPLRAFGEKGSASTGLGQPVRFGDQEEVSLDSEDTAKTWQLAVFNLGRAIFIPKRMLDQLGASGIGNYVQEKATGWGEKNALYKDDFVAGMFQKGTLTAGSATYFDNSYAEQADPNPNFIYDGKPWFDTQHNLSAAPGTDYANHTVSSALSRDNLQTGLIRHESTNAVDERGDRISNRADNLIVPPGLEYTARQILGSSLTSDQNQINAIQGRLNLVVWRALTDAASASSWWIAGAGSGVRVRDSGTPMIRAYLATDRKQGIYVEMVSHFGATVTDWRKASCFNKAAA